MKGTQKNQYRLFWGIMAFSALLACPWILPEYRISMLTEIIVFSLYAVSYNLLLGYAGLLSFGHAMFFGTGAYATAVVLKYMPGLSVWSAIIISIAFVTVIGFAVGSLLLRHKGSYFALLTMAFNALFYAVAMKWYSITGGDDGISVTRPDIDLGFVTLNMFHTATFYYFVLFVVGLVILFCWYFTKTAMGQTILMIRENEERMKFLGYNTNVSRLILFAFTGSLAGFAGSFYALHFQFVSLGAISIDMTTTVLLMTFIGGTGSFIGPILGAGVYTFLQDFLSDITDRWPLVMGLIFVGMVLYVPSGLSGIIAGMKEYISKKKPGEMAMNEGGLNESE